MKKPKPYMKFHLMPSRMRRAAGGGFYAKRDSVDGESNNWWLGWTDWDNTESHCTAISEEMFETFRREARKNHETMLGKT
jgi:hypothetical protein